MPFLLYRAGRGEQKQQRERESKSSKSKRAHTKYLQLVDRITCILRVVFALMVRDRGGLGDTTHLVQSISAEGKRNVPAKIGLEVGGGLAMA